MRIGFAAAVGLFCSGAASCVQGVNTTSDNSSVLAAGERAYRKCYACHSLEGPDATTQGPSLQHIIGRPVASEAGFAYSPAMRAFAEKQPNWTGKALGEFITDPQNIVPGNSMDFFGVADPAERRALIVYLAAN